MLTRTTSLILLCCAASAAELTAVVDGSQTLVRGQNVEFDLGVAAWGPEWAYMSWKADTAADGQASLATLTGTYGKAPAPTTIVRRVTPSGPRQLTSSFELSSTASQSYTLIAVAVSLPRAWQGSVTAHSGTATEEKPWPLGKGSFAAPIDRLSLRPAGGAPYELRIDPPATVSFDGALRITLAEALTAAQPIRSTITLDLPSEVAFHPSPASLGVESTDGRWFPWTPKAAYAAGNAFTLAGWDARPAGAAGRITRRDDGLMYDGKPFRLWGLNICYASCAPDKALADARAAFYAAHGINAVRLHKFGDGSGWQGLLKPGSNLEFDPAALDRMDYFIAQLKAKGIFVKLSNSFGSLSLASDGWDRIPYAAEIGPRPDAKRQLNTGAGTLFLSEELQDIHMAQVTGLLKHVNPYTKQTYAEDPAIAIVEMVNEESALFGGPIRILQTVPTLRERTAQRFTAWLKTRYGDEAGLRAAWGGGLQSFGPHEKMPVEDFAGGKIYPVGAPWYWDPDQLAGQMAARKQRLLDTALFYKEVQDAFYDRYSKALRDAGYAGLVMASNWQAGRAASHFYNLHSDARFDLVDRHNYFGGKDVGGSMLRVPGAGSLSAGMQQVAGRPFSLSEWIHVYPNQWGAEGPAIIGAYGLGLQGWDISYLFQNRDAGRQATMIGDDQWEATTPHLIAPFFAISRQVRRGDVAVSPVVAPMHVHLDSLRRGEIGFTDQTRQEYDIKVFDTDKVPAATLAVARTAVRFVDAPTPTPAFDLASYRDAVGVLTSAGKQLRWMGGTTPESGWFTIDTPATKAVIGFAQGGSHDLGGVRIVPRSRYALIYLTAASPNGTLAQDDRLLITASGRSHNRGMRYFAGQLLDRGPVKRGDAGPVLMEPVTASITLPKRTGTPTVHVCDHDGNRTGRTLPVVDCTIEIDGVATQTVYYEVEYR
ncbi:MAG TPA: hypothetical protein DCS97_11380 [Planctomycetes bacterium]|nr:hypothetical protein [Planctomycetota bacterium]